MLTDLYRKQTTLKSADKVMLIASSHCFRIVQNTVQNSHSFGIVQNAAQTIHSNVAQSIWTELSVEKYEKSLMLTKKMPQQQQSSTINKALNLQGPNLHNPSFLHLNSGPTKQTMSTAVQSLRVSAESRGNQTT